MEHYTALVTTVKMSGPPQTEGAGECEEGDDPGPAAAALYGGVDEEDGRQLHQPAQRRARVHARAHRARSWAPLTTQFSSAQVGN